MFDDVAALLVPERRQQRPVSRLQVRRRCDEFFAGRTGPQDHGQENLASKLKSVLFSVSDGEIKLARPGSAITNGRESRSCLDRVLNFKLGSFIDNTKILQHANGHF